MSIAEHQTHPNGFQNLLGFAGAGAEEKAELEKKQTMGVEQLVKEEEAKLIEKQKRKDEKIQKLEEAKTKAQQ